MSNWWDTSSEPVVVTEAMLTEAFAAIRDRARHPHGSAQDPHVVSPNGGPCLGCGTWFTAGEIRRG